MTAPAALCLLALTACGGGGGAKASPDVASLPGSDAASAPASGTQGAAGTPTGSAATGSGSGSAPGAGSPSGRPQERLDDSPQQREALIHVWDQCLVDHGAHWTTTRSGPAAAQTGADTIKSVADPVPPKASAACEDKLPLEPPELNPALNPHYRDDTLTEIACMRGHGVMVHLTQDTSVDPGGLGWTFDSGMTKVPDDEGRIEDQCQTQAFGGGKGK
jgi:hypothetical protein